MKKITVFLLAFVLLLPLAACADEKASAEDGGYQLYYLSYAYASGGEDAIISETTMIEDDAEMTVGQLAEALLEALLREPEQVNCRSPFPANTSLLSLNISGRCAQMDLSSAYARLSGVDLSLADYCITLTLTQIDGINAVHITANGRELPYRKTQLFTAEDTLLSGREDGLRPITVSLYYLDAALGELRAQQQTLALYEGQGRVNALLDAMLLGPENDNALVSLLPEGFYILASRIENGTCYLNLPSDTPLPETEEGQRLMFSALEQSLCSLAGVEKVQFLLDGESAVMIGKVSMTRESDEPESIYEE